LPYAIRVFHARPRLLASVGLGIVLAVFLPSGIEFARRLLIGRNAGVILYLILVGILVARTHAGQIRAYAEQEDEGRIAILALTVIATLASLGAIVVELGTNQGAVRTPIQLALATATIALSWFFIHTIFALHYAHEFYGSGAKTSGLDFPGNEEPDYWDFVYFSFVIGTTAQVSDVTIVSRPIRHVVIAHSIVSFFFNASLLALMVNIAASAI
jgi:uncharacterized membrane protein